MSQNYSNFVIFVKTSYFDIFLTFWFTNEKNKKTIKKKLQKNFINTSLNKANHITTSTTSLSTHIKQFF